MKRVNVFIVRHGERLDEVVPSRRRMSRTDRNDPPLTGRGYQQARESLTRLLQVLPAKKISVVVSPFRRTLGTAMALSSVPSSILSKFEWHYATNDGRMIPITIHNGLGDCTAQAQALGGIMNMVRAGLVPCAVMPANEYSKQGPMVEHVQAIQEQAQEENGYNNNHPSFWAPWNPQYCWQKLLRKDAFSIFMRELVDIVQMVHFVLFPQETLRGPVNESFSSCVRT